MKRRIRAVNKDLGKQESLVTLDVHFDSRLTGLQSVVSVVERSGAHILHLAERNYQDDELFPIRCVRMMLKTKDSAHAVEIIESLHNVGVQPNFINAPLLQK